MPFISSMSRIAREQVHIRIPEGAAFVLDHLHKAGYEAYIVGGCVRDSILGRTPEDWDITTSALPAEVKRVFRRTVDTGIQHGTVTVLYDREQFEVTTYRIDGDYVDARHPENVTFTRSLLEDLRRRDFTINAMAYSEETGLVDEFDGLCDIDRRLIRAVGDPVERFSEDALRILRAIRFAAQLGYEIDGGTQRAIAELAPNLQKISAERIRVELEKLLVSDHPEELRRMYALGVLHEILPEFDACMSCPQNNPHHQYNVGEHIIHSVIAVRSDRILRLAMLLHDIGKPPCRTTDEHGIDHFHGHVEKGTEMARAILKRLRYDNDTIQKVTKLVECHDMYMLETPAGVRHGIVKTGKELFPLLMEVKAADTAAQSSYHIEEKRQLWHRWMSLYEEIIARGDPLGRGDLAVSGRDLIGAGVRPGKDLGEILERMLEDVLTEPSHNTREYLLDHYVHSGE